MEKFAGGEGAWHEWEFDFRTAVRACSPHTADAMAWAEFKNKENIAMTGAILESGAPLLYPAMAKRSSKLFEVLCGLLTAEAKMLIRETEGGDGILARQKLTKSYSRRTLARTLRMYREVTLPKQVEMKDLVVTIAKWESAVVALERRGDGVLPDMVKMAALTEICPTEIRDMIYQNMDSPGQDFDKIKEKIVSWIGNRIDATNSPMDVGCVDKEWWPPGGDEEVDVNLLQCYTCGGQGHPSRICPSAANATDGKGKGKSYGKGKAYGKGKSYGKAAKATARGRDTKAVASTADSWATRR
jgi:hypothetical protein